MSLPRPDSSQAGALGEDEHVDIAQLRTLIVIPTLDEAKHIGQVLERLLSETQDLPHAVLAVVDGGSSDETCEIVTSFIDRHPRIHLLHNPERIQSAAVNLAARQLGRDTQVLIRCDAHSNYPAGFCKRLLTTLLQVRADSVVVPMVSKGSSRMQRAVAWVSNSRIGTGGSAHRGAGHPSGFVDHGHHAAFRMESFRRAGGYDERFTHNEDAEYDCRQRAFGARIYLDNEILIQYFPRASWGALWKQYFNYGAGRARTTRRHPQSVRLRQLAVVANFLMLNLTVVVAPRWPYALLWPALYLLTLMATSLWFAVHQRSLTGLLTGPSAAIMHTAWALGFLTAVFRYRESRWRVEMAAPLWPIHDPSESP